ncbi:TlpA family protein disulfide reductase [Polaribacter sp. L3A8]|uniref:TlpA family protein disulfide reductase n=1 Tax=Polaribacter sp. L3A8 TaxID=2686361 RepID=UPI00131E29E3|nr:thioredoxin-like domain-containing protein [Polaribacter sp. L3A8]
MKKILAFIFLISSFAQAQYTVNGTMYPTLKSDWVILYKIEGATQKFVQNSKIAIDTVTIQGKKQAIGKFSFTLPTNTKPGSYRLTYKLEEAGFVDFIFNKEDVSFSFNPNYGNQTVFFTASKENILYKSYLDKSAAAQQTLDSIQVVGLQNKSLNLNKEYKKALKQVNDIQKEYLETSNGMYVYPFIKASLKNNSSDILKTPEEYMSSMNNTFFNNIDFDNKTLLNSSFLISRITDYVFYINFSEDQETQQKLYKKSVDTVLSKIESITYKKDVIEFLITQFESSMNLDLIDYLFETYYNKLPTNIQNKSFKESKQALFAAEIGRIAPDFSWKENGKELKLSKLGDAENYLLIFWSTTCSHCLNEVPQVHKFLKENKKVKVIAFSLEKEAFGWNSFKNTLPNWHHVLGLNKWENKIARTYNIVSTPSYFILDANKKIIAKPEHLKDVKDFFTEK